MSLHDMDKKPASAKRGRMTQPPAVMCIEGEFVTWAQIAERTGLSAAVARSRMDRLAVVTWRGIAGE